MNKDKEVSENLPKPEEKPVDKPIDVPPPIDPTES